MLVWGDSEPFKAFAKGTVPVGSIMTPPTEAGEAKMCFAAEIPWPKAGQF